MLVGLVLAGLFAAFLLLGRKPPTSIFVALGTLTGSYAAERLVSGWQYVGAGNGLSSIKLLQLGTYEFVEGTAFYFLALGLLRRWSMLGARFLKSRSSAWCWRACARTRSAWPSSATACSSSRRWCSRSPGMVAGLGGALYSYHQGFIGPGNMGPGLSTTAVIYCLFGGSGTLIGPILGTATVEVLSYVLSDVDAIKQIWPVILGLVLLVVVMFQPKGILGLIVSDRERIGSYGRRRRGRGAPGARRRHGAARDPRRQQDVPHVARAGRRRRRRAGRHASTA